MFLGRKPYGFGTENVKGRQLETDSIPFDNTLVHSLLNKLSNEIKTVSKTHFFEKKIRFREQHIKKVYIFAAF